MTEYELFMRGERPGTEVLHADEHLRVVVFRDDATAEQIEEALAEWGFVDCEERAWRCVYIVSGMFNTEHPRSYQIDPCDTPPVYGTTNGRQTVAELRKRLHLDDVWPVIVAWFKRRATVTEEAFTASGQTDEEMRQAGLLGLFLCDQKALREVLDPAQAADFLATLPLASRIEALLSGFGGDFNDLRASDAVFEADGVKMYFNDWTDSDLLMVFSDEGRRRNDRECAATLFGGDAYEWFDSSYRDKIDDILRYNSLNSKTEAAVAQALIDNGSLMALDNGDEVVEVEVTAELIAEHGLEECLKMVAEHDPNDPIVDAVEDGYDDAYRSAKEGAFYNGYCEAVNDVMGVKPVWEGNRLMFKVPYRVFAGFLQGYEDYNGEPFTFNPGDSIAHLVQYSEDKASVCDDYDGDVSKADFSECVLERLSWVK